MYILLVIECGCRSHCVSFRLTTQVFNTKSKRNRIIIYYYEIIYKISLVLFPTTKVDYHIKQIELKFLFLYAKKQNNTHLSKSFFVSFIVAEIIFHCFYQIKNNFVVPSTILGKSQHMYKIPVMHRNLKKIKNKK